MPHVHIPCPTGRPETGTPVFAPNKDIAGDTRYLSNPLMWNAWPYCPVKRYVSGRLEVAYFFNDQDTHAARENGRVRLRWGTMFGAKPDDPIFEYPSWDAFFADGWMVD